MTGGTEVLACSVEPVDPPIRHADKTARPDRRRAPLVVLGLTAVLAVPLVVTLAALSTPRWHPLLDLAQTEMRVRDVGTRHSPLVGLVGRINAYGHDGSHPGPLSFWSLAPIYRALGGGAFGLLVGVVVLNVTAVGLSVWVALRQGGARLALVVAAVGAVLLHVYGTNVLTEPWNPYMPVLWWFLTVLALWAVLCDDLAMLPVATFAASFCMQTHVSYLGLVGGLVALTLVAAVVRAVRLRHDGASLRRLAGWAGVAVAVGVVLWIPPVIDQFVNEPGNALIVVKNFSEPDADPLGLGRGAEVFGTHLNLWRFVRLDDQVRTGSALPAAALVAVWSACWALTWAGRRAAPADDTRRRDRDSLLRLHGLVAVVLVLGLITTSQIVGPVWFYLTLWAWSVTALALVAILWSLVTALPPGPSRAARATGVGVNVALALVLVAWTAQLAVSGAGAEVSASRTSSAVGEMTAATVSALESGTVPGGGADGRYLVTWIDGVELGAGAWGLVNELERRGYDVGVPEAHGNGAKPHRVRPADEATAEIHVAVGTDIARWRTRPDATEIVYVDTRSAALRAEHARLLERVATSLEEAGRPDDAARLEDAPFAYYIDETLPDAIRRDIERIVEITAPSAVFVAPGPRGEG